LSFLGRGPNLVDQFYDTRELHGAIITGRVKTRRQRKKDKETGRQGDRETRRQGDKETGRQGDRETRRQGDKETGRQGDSKTGNSEAA